MSRTHAFQLTLALGLLTVLALNLLPAACQSEMTTILEGLNHPVGVAVDAVGNIYFTEYAGEGEGLLKRVTSERSVETLAFALSSPTGVVVDLEGNIYFAESVTGTIKKLDPSTRVVEVVAEGLLGAWGLSVDREGLLYVTDKSVNGTLKSVDPATGAVTTLLERLNVPYGVTVDSQGNIYFVEFGEQGKVTGTLKVLMHEAAEPMTLIEGLAMPYAVAVNAEGDIFFTIKGGDLLKLPAGGGDTITIASGLGRVYGMAITGEELYLVEFGNPLGGGDGTLKKMNISAGPTTSLPPPTTTPALKPSTMTIAVPSVSVALGDEFKVNGNILPAVADARVELTYISPNGTELRRVVVSGTDGRYSDSFSPDVTGSWVVFARWAGNSEYLGTASPAATVKVEGGFSFIEVGLTVGVVVAVFAVVGFAFLRRTRRRKSR